MIDIIIWILAIWIGFALFVAAVGILVEHEKGVSAREHGKLIGAFFLWILLFPIWGLSRLIRKLPLIFPFMVGFGEGMIVALKGDDEIDKLRY